MQKAWVQATQVATRVADAPTSKVQHTTEEHCGTAYLQIDKFSDLFQVS